MPLSRWSNIRNNYEHFFIPRKISIRKEPCIEKVRVIYNINLLTCLHHTLSCPFLIRGHLKRVPTLRDKGEGVEEEEREEVVHKFIDK